MFASPIKQSGQARRQLTVQGMTREEYDNISHTPSNRHAQKSRPNDPMGLPDAIQKAELKITDKTPPRPSPVPPLEPAKPQPTVTASPPPPLPERKPLSVLQTLQDQPRRRSSVTKSILDSFAKDKPSQAPPTNPRESVKQLERPSPPRPMPEHDKPAPRQSGVRNVNYGILDSFKKHNQGPSRVHQIYGNDENDGSPSRVNAMDSPVSHAPMRPSNRATTVNDLLLPHVLLGLEVNRLMEVIRQYQGNLETLSADIDDLTDENYRLKEELAERPVHEHLDQLKEEKQRLIDQINDLHRDVSDKEKEAYRNKEDLGRSTAESQFAKSQLADTKDENKKLRQLLEEQEHETQKQRRENDLIRKELIDAKDIIEQIKLELKKARYEEERSKTDYDRMKLDRDALNTQMLELHKRISTLQNQVLNPPKPEPVQHEQIENTTLIMQRNNKLTLSVTDFLHDDKNNLLQLLVRRNLENDQLRKEVELLRSRINIGDLPYNKNPDRFEERSIAKDILEKLGEVMTKNKDRLPDMHSDFEIVKSRTEGLCIRIDSYGDRTPMGDSNGAVGNPGLADTIKNMHSTTQTVGRNAYEQERYGLFEALDGLIRKLTDLSKTFASNGGKSDMFKPMQPNQTNELKAELASALKKIVDLETQKSLLTAKLDALTVGRSDVMKPATPFSQLVNLSAAHTVTCEELRGQLLAAKNEANEWKFRYEQSQLEKDKLSHDLEDSRDRLTDLHRDLDALAFKEKQALDRISEVEIEKSRVNEKNRQLEERIRQMRKETDELLERRDEQASDDRFTLQAMKDKMRDMDRKIEEKNAELEDVRRDAAEKVGRIAEIEGKLKGILDDNTALRDKLKRLEGTIQAKNEDLEEIAKKLAAKEREAEGLKEAERRLNEDLADVDNTCEFLKDKAEELKTSLEESQKKEKELTEEVTNLKNIIHQYEHQVKSMGEQLEHRHNEYTQVTVIRTQQQTYFVNTVQKFQHSLMDLRGQVDDLRAELRTAKEFLGMKMIDVAKYLGSLKTLFWTRAELNPRGTLSAYRTLKDRHNHEVPRLQGQLQDALNSKNQTEHQTAVHHNKNMREFEELERKLNQEKDRIVKEDRQTMDKYRTENDELKRNNRKLEELVREAVEENKRMKRDIDKKDVQVEQLSKEVEGSIKKAEETRVKNLVLEEQIKSLTLTNQQLQSMANQQPPAAGFGFYNPAEQTPVQNRNNIPKGTKRYGDRLPKRKPGVDEEPTDPSIKYSMDEEDDNDSANGAPVRDVTTKKTPNRKDRFNKDTEQSTNRDPRGLRFAKPSTSEEEPSEKADPKKFDELQEALHQSYLEISALRDELAIAGDKIHFYEHQLAGESIASRQAEQLGRQIVMLEERLEAVTIAAQSKDRELELKDREIVLREREIDERDKEIEALKRNAPGGNTGRRQSNSPSSSGDENEKIEVLRQRTEAMLSKVDKKISDLISSQTVSPRQAEPLIEDSKQLRKRLGDANKRYVNEYIAVCQKGIEIYEATQSYDR
jgi:chromosome segregation ATPase